MRSNMAYFDALYQTNDDPWGLAQRWYEVRKRDICLALLLQPVYHNVLEVGCANGVFSQALADRCQQLLCLDANSRAVQLAQARLQPYSHVEVKQQRIPAQYPAGQYDLIVISEVAYYLSQPELLQLIEQLEHSLAAGGTLLCCHWRYPIEGFDLTGDQVHTLLRQHVSLHHYLGLNDPDFLVDLWTSDQRSLALKEGLL